MFADAHTLTPRAFVALPALQRASKTDVTRRVEADFALGDCLYFFASHACPSFGDVVMVYDEKLASHDAGDATPFDTGGLHARHIRYTVPHEAPAEYCQKLRCPLGEWQEHARSYVEEHFTSTQAYVTGERPVRDDPSGRLMFTTNERRAWTWEIRIQRDHPFESSLLGVWMGEAYYEELRQEIVRAGEHGNACARLLREGVVRRSADPHREAEAEVARWR